MLANPSALTVDPVGPVVTPQEIKQLRKKAATLGRLFELSKTLASVFNLDDIFDHVSELLFKETPADFVVIFLAQSDGELVPEKTKTRGVDGPTTAPIAVSRTILRRAIDERMSVLVCDDVQANNRSSTMMLQNIHSAICAPLIGSKGVLGAVYLDRRAALNTLTADDLELINAIAGQVSIAVEKTLTYRELSRAEVARADYHRFSSCGARRRVRSSRTPRTEPRCAGRHRRSRFCSRTSPVLRRCPSGPIQSRSSRSSTVSSLCSPISCSTLAARSTSTSETPSWRSLARPTSVNRRRSTRCARRSAWRDRLDLLNDEFAALNFPHIQLSIGLSTGPATVGYIGSERRMDYTAIGDTVNLAARLQSNARPGQILVSETTAAAIGAAAPMRPLGQIKVKGRETPVGVYEIALEAEHLSDATHS